MNLADITICTFLQIWVDVFQQIISLAWTPLSLFGITTPSLSGILSPLFTCLV
jgi:hypothetical protein